LYPNRAAWERTAFHSFHVTSVFPASSGLAKITEWSVSLLPWPFSSTGLPIGNIPAGMMVELS
jgi:hypothetical protein